MKSLWPQMKCSMNEVDQEIAKQLSEWRIWQGFI